MIKKTTTPASLKRIEELEKEIEKLTNELENEKTKSLRSLADLENFRRRETETRTQWVNLGLCDFLKKIVPALNEILLGANHTKDKDIQKVISKFFAKFSEQGLVKINPKKGEQINTNLHEIVMIEQGKQNTVVNVLEAGWSFNDTVICPAKVSSGNK